MKLEIRATPLRKTFVVGASQSRAFHFFAHRMHNWSPEIQSLLGSRANIVVEPRPGGRWYEVSSAGIEADWGKVLVWEPPHRMILAWQLDANFAFDPNLTTEVEVKFIEEGPRQTRIDFEHRNLDRFGDRSAEVFAALDSEGGWSGSFTMLLNLIEREEL